MDEVFEIQSIKEDWEKVTSCRENEILEEQARKQVDVPAEAEPEEATPLSAMRRPATEFPEHSHAFWRALGNTAVRRYVTFATLPSTQTQIQRDVSQCALKDVVLPEGQK